MAVKEIFKPIMINDNVEIIIGIGMVKEKTYH